MCSKNQPTEDYFKQEEARIAIFFKCKRIIDGCKDLDQMDVAYKYCWLYVNNKLPHKTEIENLAAKNTWRMLQRLMHYKTEQATFIHARFVRVESDGLSISYISNPTLDE